MLECSGLKNPEVLEQFFPLVIAQPHAIHAHEEGRVIERDAGAIDAGHPPLPGDFAEKRPGRPVLGPDLDKIEAKVCGVEKAARCAAPVLNEVGSLGGQNQFPRLPSTMAER